jgi:hypothetical protein
LIGVPRAPPVLSLGLQDQDSHFVHPLYRGTHAYLDPGGQRRVDIIEDIITQCGGVPLALSAIGGPMVQHPAEDWHERLEQIRNADLTGLHVESEYEYNYVFAALLVSFKALRETLQPCFLELAALPERTAYPEAIQRTLWPGQSSTNVREELIRGSLVERGVDKNAIELHSLWHKFACQQKYQDEDGRKAMALIHAAVLLSSHVVVTHPEQFASQLVGRLLPYKEIVGVDRFLQTVERGAPDLGYGQ